MLQVTWLICTNQSALFQFSYSEICLWHRLQASARDILNDWRCTTRYLYFITTSICIIEQAVIEIIWFSLDREISMRDAQSRLLILPPRWGRNPIIILWGGKPSKGVRIIFSSPNLRRPWLQRPRAIVEGDGVLLRRRRRRLREEEDGVVFIVNLGGIPSPQVSGAKLFCARG